MPYHLRKEKDGKYSVIGPEGKVHADHTTKGKATAQMRLLYGIESGSIKQRYKPPKRQR